MFQIPNNYFFIIIMLILEDLRVDFFLVIISILSK